ncbi:ABC transporter ATP-binding protein [Idiomarina sp.]|uniref:ABC transporter ATP-binding protein n=1 Tax=Idiomarina sp. TaxID=1874361 RepID=UPI00258E05F8|nr:ABC transporter ATP-binding protein [Idiomarina sp.]
MLVMNNITKVFRTETVETHALKQFSLTVNEGDFVAVTGPSGSGKTTFLNIAGLLESFDDGEYTLDGRSVKNLNDKQLTQLRNEKICVIFQSINLIPDLNLFDNVDVPLRYRKLSKAERKERIEHSLDVVGLANRMRHLPSQLSGGQQQRVAIARALAGNPLFLLADEPTGNLDSKMADSVMSLLEEINQSGTTIVMVTHDLSQAERAHRHIQVLDGQVTEQKRGAPELATVNA